MSEPYVGEIRMFGGNFAPRGWQLCQGQILAIAQNSALFSILGTTYGGNGQTTFALPDLRGRYPMNWGQGPALSARVLGEQAGSETVTLISTEIPAHNHLLAAVNGVATSETPGGNVWSNASLSSDGAAVSEYSNATPNTTLAANAVQPAGGSQPHTNMPPFLAVSFIIAMQGIYPSRN